MDKESASWVTENTDSNVKPTDTRDQLCLFHERKWRNKFQHVLNNLNGKLLPKKHLRRVGKIVCNCNNGRGLQDGCFNDFRKYTMNSVRSFFSSEFTKPNPLLKDVESLLKECLWNEGISSTESRWRFLMVIKGCVEQNYKIFHLKTKQPVGKEKLWKQRYLLNSELQVSFPRSYIRFILGSKGQHIQRLCREYNCEIRFDVRRYGISPGRHFGLACGSPEEPCHPVRVELYCNDPNKQPDVRDALFHHIACVVQKRSKHQAALDEFEKRKSEYLLRKYERRMRQYDCLMKNGYTIGPANPWGAAVNRKVHATASFQRRAKRTQKDKNMQRHNKPPPVLQGGSCRNCLQLFKKGTFKMDACKYHPGFLASQKDIQRPLLQTNVWSCCGEPSQQNSHVAQREAHKQTGCTTTVHDYRLPKTINPCGRKSNGSNRKMDIGFETLSLD